MHRAHQLLLLDARAGLHRVRHDLGRELTVLACSVVLLALFGYVFHDFLNVQVASLSEGMRAAFARAAAVATLVLGAVAGAVAVRTTWRSRDGLGETALRLGEDQGTVRAYRIGRSVVVMAVIHGAAWYAVVRWMTVPKTGTIVAAEGAMLALASVLPLFRSSAVKGLQTAEERKSGSAEGGGLSLVAWRLRQLRRRRASVLAFAAALLFAAIAALPPLANIPPFASCAAALGASLFAATALSFQLTDDLREAWIERQLGVSHAAFVNAYERLGLLLGSAVGLVATLAYVGGALASGHGVHPVAPLQIFAIGALAPVTLPWLMMQIDGRRPAVVLLTSILVGLFIGTAIVAHPLSLGLIPILRYYGAKSQDGRYYRA